MPSPPSGHPSSYRDPSGFIYWQDGKLYRQVNRRFQPDYDLFISSGLYEQLVNENKLIPHKEVINPTDDADCYKTLEPEFIPFFSFPSEWSFDMLKDAALLTLDVALAAIQKGMVLKDASAFNVQLHKGKMIFIDTLSFERYEETEPWIAYRQFCEHFLAPLALMHYLREPLASLLLTYPEGLPLPLVRKLLPFRSKLNLHTYLNLHVHGSMAARKNTPAKETATHSFSRQKMLNLLRSLKEAVTSYKLEDQSGVWSGYYEEAKERPGYVVAKKSIIENWLDRLSLTSAIDVGANEGEFSRLLSDRSVYTISADFDHYSVNRLYQQVRKGKPDPDPPVGGRLQSSHPGHWCQ
jgi:hypothetical protein